MCRAILHSRNSLRPFKSPAPVLTFRTLVAALDCMLNFSSSFSVLSVCMCVSPVKGQRCQGQDFRRFLVLQVCIRMCHISIRYPSAITPYLKRIYFSRDFSRLDIILMGKVLQNWSTHVNPLHRFLFGNVQFLNICLGILKFQHGNPRSFFFL